MGLRDRLRRTERASKAHMIEVPQQDGSVARFPQSASAEAVLNFFDRLGAGEEAPPEHPLLAAARNSSDPWWRNSFYAVDEDITAPFEDLSEP